MAEGITGWRLHVGVIFPTPVPPRPIREWYQVVPEGVDITTVSLTIQQLTDDNMEEALKGMERAAKQLSNFDVDVIVQSGVPPIVARGTPGFANEVQQRLERFVTVYPYSLATGMTGVQYVDLRYRNGFAVGGLSKQG